MPSWNIHTAHVECLLKEEAPERLGIKDVNCFQFGNYVPDVYVGYMVQNTTRLIDYCITHFAEPNPIPVPQAEKFWQRFIADGTASDLCLGVWAHLVADAVYNQATRDFLEKHSLEINSATRIQKQRDFANFGKTLSIGRHCELTPELIEQGARFPQYTLHEQDIAAAVEVVNSITDNNQLAQEEEDEAVIQKTVAEEAVVKKASSYRISGHEELGCEESSHGQPLYDLLDEAFFSATFEKVHKLLITRLRSYAQERDGIGA